MYSCFRLTLPTLVIIAAALAFPVRVIADEIPTLGTSTSNAPAPDKRHHRRVRPAISKEAFSLGEIARNAWDRLEVKDGDAVDTLLLYAPDQDQRVQPQWSAYG